jgi:hypothetical protein
MKLPHVLASLAALIALAGLSKAAPLYSEDFDINPTANWTVNNNGAGTNAAKLGANLNSATAPASGNIPGITVSPTGQSFTGDYELRFDWWENYIGPLDVGATGSTQIGEFGIQSSGAAANFPGSAESVFFAATGDGQSSADYRIYSPERPTSYDIFPASGNPLDAHAVYAAGSRNQSAALYMTTFPAGATAPGSQASEPTQTSSTPAGAAGFRWHDMSIKKVGNIVTWTVDGVLLGTVDETLFGTAPGGTNILLGHADTNLTTNSNAALLDRLQFTLIDNVTVVPEPCTAMLAVSLALMSLLEVRRRM